MMETGTRPRVGRRVLIVDDDRAIRDLLALMLESEGYEVALARDGLEALAQVEASEPAVILLDLMMPRMDGVSFADELGRRGLRAATPIVVMSACGLAQQGAGRIAADGAVSKPFDLGELLPLVARLAGRADQPGAFCGPPAVRPSARLGFNSAPA
jgi:CheY-like chemotaxis protein